jgi:DNA-binding FadR family transcriptional regulator
MPRLKLDAPDTHRTMQVVDHIRSLMQKGTLQPGDQIPPEREFARTLKISRASLRTGINYLAAMGVLKVRHGVGTFVADGPPEFDKASLSLMGVLHGFQSWQMFEARLILESSLAELAAERSTEEHHAALSEEVAEMFAALGSPADYLIHDILFHRIISQASGNPILATLMKPSPPRSTTTAVKPSSTPAICANPPRSIANSTAPSAPATPPKPAASWSTIYAQPRPPRRWKPPSLASPKRPNPSPNKGHVPPSCECPRDSPPPRANGSRYHIQ